MSKDFDTTDIRNRAKQREADYINAGYRNSWDGVTTQIEVEAEQRKPLTRWFKRLLDGVATEMRSDS